MTSDWRNGIPVWSHDGIVCTGEMYKNATINARAFKKLRGWTP